MCVIDRDPARGGRSGPTEEFDYIVVGGGSAGCVLAGRLSADPAVRVLLLEAGPGSGHPFVRVPAAFPRLFGGRLDWGRSTTPQDGLAGRRVLWPSGRVLGGSSSINAMMWVRPMRPDYGAWSAAGGDRWGFEALDPYFDRIEDAEGLGEGHRRGGAVSIARQRDPHRLTAAFLEAASQCGIPRDPFPNLDEPAGASEAAVTQRRGARCSAADAYLRPARRRANLVVRTGALCERVVFSGTEATGVEYRLRTGPSRRAGARREVVLAAGAVGSPALLWRSGVGPGRDLATLGVEVVADRPEVGRNLEDHVTAGVVVATPGERTLASARSARELAAYVFGRRGMLTSPICEAYAFVSSVADAAPPDLELVFAPVAFLDEGTTLPRLHAMTLAAVLLQPESRGSVRLASADPAEAPIVDPAYLSDAGGHDAATLEAGVAWCLRLLRTPALARVAGEMIAPPPSSGPGADADLVRAAVRDFAQTLYHPVGTCRLGSDASSVVDPELAVRGVTRLRVADASVIPRIVRGHTNAPTLLVAERAADLITGRRDPAPTSAAGTEPGTAS